MQFFPVSTFHLQTILHNLRRSMSNIDFQMVKIDIILQQLEFVCIIIWSCAKRLRYAKPALLYFEVDSNVENLHTI